MSGNTMACPRSPLERIVSLRDEKAKIPHVSRNSGIKPEDGIAAGATAAGALSTVNDTDPGVSGTSPNVPSNILA
jgi:hypothetical protein